MLDKLGTIQMNLAQYCCKKSTKGNSCSHYKRKLCNVWQSSQNCCKQRCWLARCWITQYYNSIAGHTLLVGGYTKPVLAFKFFLKICQTCSNLHKKYDFDVNLVLPHQCSKNWSDSSKAMEPNDIVDCVKQIWNSGTAWLKVFVSNDDSSSHAALKHTLEARMTLENLTEPPCGLDGKKLKDTGKLPAEIREPTTFLFIHCTAIVFMDVTSIV